MVICGQPVLINLQMAGCSSKLLVSLDLSNKYCEILCFIRAAPVITYKGDDARPNIVQMPESSLNISSLIRHLLKVICGFDI
jgi:hypothetical protein